MAMDEVQIGANIQETCINNLRFADDIVLIAETPDELHTLVDKIYEASCVLGLKVNIAKTEVQGSAKGKCNLNIDIANDRLKQVEDFVYMGGSRRAGAAFRRLKNICTSTSISSHTKMLLYQSLILSILLYGAESWTV
ncbi:uncharacterized protein LOC100890430 [Strongylocentrotus purpuratus]|uniref:Reverse transcriptase domain-containing protein n=1 Tax=Strongylocentrotus purpuratus TaxID=7668 RepID=A0A7M7LWC0_STRPU|nr:uncharacterized protein LOC100890430 [Strongylocentrotus purpuratus]|eukprot:XP_011676899.1 PREDICTED: putative uncharacterized transposon-derived protein F52C9.6 [Strongylocentrotus purpuratus]